MKNKFGYLVAAVVLGLFASTNFALAASTTEGSVPRAGGEDNTWYLSAGPGLAIHSGTGWSINAGALRQAVANSGLYVGADLGLDFWSASASVGPTSVSTGATAVQLLPTAIYRFDIDSAPAIHPYFGLSFGPNIYTNSFTTNGKSSSNTTLYIETLVRPGIFMPLTSGLALNMEAKFGLLGTAFIFLPNVQVTFTL